MKKGRNMQDDITKARSTSVNELKIHIQHEKGFSRLSTKMLPNA